MRPLEDKPRLDPSTDGVRDSAPAARCNAGGNGPAGATAHVGLLEGLGFPGGLGSLEGLGPSLCGVRDDDEQALGGRPTQLE